MTRCILDRFPGLDVTALNAFEIAAVVYDEGASIDHLMSFFASEVAGAGHAVAGILRAPVDDETDPFEVMVDIATGHAWTLGCSWLSPSGSEEDDRCRAEMVETLSGAIPAKSDIAFIPRFGTEEIAGAGFSDAFAALAAHGIPILTAVRRDDVDAWLAFTGGIGTLIACRLKVIRDWWRETESRHRRIMRRRDMTHPDGGAEIIPLRPFLP